MKIVSKIVAAAMALATVATLAACGEKDDNVLTMATNATFPPYEYYEGKKIVGIDAEIGQAIADKLGMEFKIEDMEFNSIISSVNAGGADIGMAGMTVTDKRKKSVDFSDTYANGVQVIIVKEDSDIKGPDDLVGKKIGTQVSTTGDIYATDDFGADNVTQYNKATDTVLGLKNGDVDAVIIDNEVAKSFVKSNEGLKILDTEYANEDYAICVKKGNTELLDKINKALKELKEDGTIKKIVDKYITAE